MPPLAPYLTSDPVHNRAGAAYAGVLHATLWFFIVALSAAILVYPRVMALQYSPIQSLDVVEPVSRFGTLYYVWITVLVSLLLFRDPRRTWQRRGLILSVLFVLIYRGFWDVSFASVRNADAVLNEATAEHIRSVGRVPSPLDFRGLQVLAAFLSTTSGIHSADGVRILMLLFDVLLGGMFFLLSYGLLGDARLAVIGAVLAMQGNIVFPRLVFYPGTLGLVFASIFLFLALRRSQGAFLSPSGAILTLLVLAANTVTHFVTSTLLFCLLLWMWLVALARKEFERRRDERRLLVFAYGIVPFAWLSYAAVQTFRSLALLAGQLPGNLQSESFLRAVLLAGQANYGAGVPPWAVAARGFWIFLLLGVGVFAVFCRLVRLRSLPTVEARAIGAFLGIVFLSIVNTSVSTGGFEFVRFPLYTPLVSAPLLLLAIARLPSGLRTISFGTLVVFIVALSLPTFLASYPTIRTEVFYQHEFLPAQLLAKHTDDPHVKITAAALGYVPYARYMPDAQYVGTPPEFALIDEAGVWAFLDQQARDFVSEKTRATSFFVDSARPRAYYRHNFGISPSDPRWDAIRSIVRERAAVYDNGFVALYEATAP